MRGGKNGKGSMGLMDRHNGRTWTSVTGGGGAVLGSAAGRYPLDGTLGKLPTCKVPKAPEKSVLGSMGNTNLTRRAHAGHTRGVAVARCAHATNKRVTQRGRCRSVHAPGKSPKKARRWTTLVLHGTLPALMERPPPPPTSLRWTHEIHFSKVSARVEYVVALWARQGRDF